jgi:hypothetical protein
VISALHDQRNVQRQELTLRWWSGLGLIEAASSEVTREEIEQTPDVARKTAMLQSFLSLSVFSVTDEMRRLAQRYIDAGVFTTTMENDSLHVAAAVVSRQNVIVSWNFGHLVNRKRRAGINMVNLVNGMPTIEIIAPPEM